MKWAILHNDKRCFLYFNYILMLIVQHMLWGNVQHMVTNMRTYSVGRIYYWQSCDRASTFVATVWGRTSFNMFLSVCCGRNYQEAVSFFMAIVMCANLNRLLPRCKYNYCFRMQKWKEKLLKLNNNVSSDSSNECKMCFATLKSLLLTSLLYCFMLIVVCFDQDYLSAAINWLWVDRLLSFNCSD